MEHLDPVNWDLFKPKKRRGQGRTLKHSMRLQSVSSRGVPVPYSEFWITIVLTRVGDEVTLRLPKIGFRLGSRTGGRLVTVKGRLPHEFRPSGVENVTFTVDSLKQETAYNVTVSEKGRLEISGRDGVLSSGSHSLLPTETSFSRENRRRILVDQRLSTDPIPKESVEGTFSHDAFDGVVAYSWPGVDRLFVGVGAVEEAGVTLGEVAALKIKEGTTIQSISVVVSRVEKENIVVAYTLVDKEGEKISCRAVSFDLGETWQINGYANLVSEPNLRSDRYGNLWYGCGYVSVDRGRTFSKRLPLDSSEFTLGGEEYGIQSQGSFTPIYGLGEFGETREAVPVETPKGSLYDSRRKALYRLFVKNDTELLLTISRGGALSDPIEVAKSRKGKKLCQSFALDVVAGDLLIGWLDKRGEELSQYAAVVPSEPLSELVKRTA